MNDTNTATIRTTVQGTALAFLVLLANRIFGWRITLEDLLPYTPVIAAVVAGFYRLSLVLSEMFPKVGYVLFGVRKAPSYPPPDPPVHDPNLRV